MAQQPTPDAEQLPYIYRVNYADRTDTVMKRVQSLFVRMKHLTAAARVPLHVILIPERLQFDGDAFKGLPADIDKPQRLLMEFFEREGIESVDLLPWLKEKSVGERLCLGSRGLGRVPCP